MMVSSLEITMRSPQQMISEVWENYQPVETEYKGIKHVVVGVTIAAYGVLETIKLRNLNDYEAFTLNQVVLCGLDITLYGLIELALPITCHTIYKIARSWSQL